MRFDWRFETSTMFGAYWILPYLCITPAFHGIHDGHLWDFQIGWLRWGLTFSIGRKP